MTTPTDIAAWSARGNRVPVRHRTLFVCDVAGPAGGGTPALLIHGFPTSAWDWTPILDQLSAARRVVAPDLLGFGLSDKPWPHDYSLLEQCDYLVGLVKDLGIKRVHLVAHDMGDTVVQELLARRLESEHFLPFEIASVTLLNGGVLVDRYKPIAAQRLMRLPLVGRLVGLAPEPVARRLFFRSMQQLAGDNPPSHAELSTQWRLIESGGGARVLPGLIGYMREREQHPRRWRGAIMKHGFPMHLVWGDRDPINSWEVVTDIERERTGPTTVTRVAGAGHYPQLERPAQVADAIAAFLARHDAPAGAA